MPNYDVIGIGRAFTDFIAPASHELLDRYAIPYGAGKELTIEQLARLKEELHDVQLLPGGPVGNTIAGVAALGGKGGFFGKVARDVAGQSYTDDLKVRGIDLIGEAYCTNAPMSAMCVVLVLPDGERSCPYNRGCADDFTSKDFTAFDFCTSKFLLIQGHLLMSSPATPAVLEAIDLAKKASCQVVVTVSDIPLWDIHRKIAYDVIAAKADIITGNEDEMAAFERMIALPHSEGQLIVTTKGKQGAEAQLDSEYVNVMAQKPKAFKNSVGAGDQFLAGLLRGLSLNFTLQESMELGVRSATAILEEVGARPNPTHSWASLIPIPEG